MTQIEAKIDTRAAAQTGIAPTMMVAIEQNFPSNQRVIHDDLAVKVLPGSYQIVVNLMRVPLLRDWMVNFSEKQVAGIWSGMMCRKRYIDDKVVLALAEEKPVEAVVNLGAGYDTRVYRLPPLANVPVWEVDQPVNIEAKEERLQKALGKIPANVTLVPINFVEQKLGDVLKTHGYPASTKTFFVWEAVSQYLTEAAVRQLFEFLAHAPTDSHLAFTYVLKDFIEGKQLFGLETFYQRIVEKDRVWHFGFAPEDVADFLSEYGWRLVEDLGYDELAEQYVKPTGRQLPVMAIERMVYALKE